MDLYPLDVRLLLIPIVVLLVFLGAGYVLWRKHR